MVNIGVYQLSFNEYFSFIHIHICRVIKFNYTKVIIKMYKSIKTVQFDFFFFFFIEKTTFDIL